MDNFQLYKVLGDSTCGGDDGDGDRFKVIASDELPVDKQMPAGEFVVCNLDVRDSGIGGWHWVLFYSAGESTLYYFDSLGECPEHYGRMPEFIRLYRKISTNQGFNVQFNTPDVESTTCGVHVVYVASKLCTGKYTLDDVMQFYRRGRTLADVNHNECMALHYVLKKFVKHSKMFAKIKGCYDE
jgi:hypothetical protein